MREERYIATGMRVKLVGVVHREDHTLLFFPQYFLSLICLLFFKLDPEPCPPAKSLAQRRGGLSQLQASLEPCAQRWRRWRRGREVCSAGWKQRHRERRKLREAADDSVSAAEDIALKDTTLEP